MSFNEDKYLKVTNLLSDDICKIIERYALFDRINDYEKDNQVPGSHSKYADQLMESILMFLKPVIETYTGLKLLPTYSFYRIYEPNNILDNHVDRPSCEVSVTIPIGFKYVDKPVDYRWPLYVHVKGEKRYINCDVGEGVIYRGCELQHGRDTFNVAKDSYQIQLFLHYVDANGPYSTEYKYDGRSNVGIKKHQAFPFIIT
jgi:hypothetical protein